MGGKKKKKGGGEKALERRVHELEAQAKVDAALFRIAQAASSAPTCRRSTPRCTASSAS